MEGIFRGGSESDDEIFLQQANDEDEYHYSSSSISKLQFRKELSRARWVDEMGMAEVIEKKGQIWVTTGIVRNGKTYCSIEEILFFMEVGALCLVDDNGTCICLEDIYKKIEGKRGAYCLELFDVYRHLKSLGYIVGRHDTAWSLKAVKSTCKPVSLQVSEESSEVMTLGSADKLSIIELFGTMQINDMMPVFDAYLPNSRFRKSSPGCPNFTLYLSRDCPPSKAEIEVLERRCGGIPLKICQVDNGRVSFFSFDKVELLVLP